MQPDSATSGPAKLSVDRPPLGANTLYLTLAAGVVAAVRFGTNWLIAWRYGPADHGRFTVVFQLVSMVVVVAEVGIVSTFGIRQIAAARSGSAAALNRRINSLSGTLLGLHLAVALMLAVLGPTIGKALHADGQLLQMAAVWIVGLSLYRTGTMVANGLETMVFTAATTLMVYGLWSLWLALAVVRGFPLAVLVAGWALSTLVAGGCSAWALAVLLRRFGLRWRLRLTGLVQTTTTAMRAWPYSLALSGTLILPGIVCLLLVRWHRVDAEAQVSYFQICFSLGILANLFAVPMASAILPALTRLLHETTEPEQAAAAGGTMAAGRLLGEQFTVLTWLVTLVFALYWPLGRWLLGLVDEGYRPHVPVLLIVAAGVALDGTRLLVDQLLIAANRVRVVAWFEIGRLVVLVVVAYLCIGVLQWGAKGAAVSVLVAMAANALIRAVVAQRMTGLLLTRWFGALVLVLMAILLVGSVTADRAGGSAYAWLTIPTWILSVGLLVRLGSLPVITMPWRRATPASATR